MSLNKTTGSHLIEEGNSYGTTSGTRKFEKPLDYGKTVLTIDDSPFNNNYDDAHHYRGKKEKTATYNICMSLLKAILIMVVFAFFIGAVVLVVELVDMFHEQQVRTSVKFAQF